MGEGSSNWVERWEDWRTLLGPTGSLQRRRVMEYLERRLCVMYWGDSWFSTPLYKNLAKQSWPRIDGIGIIVAKPGAQAKELFTDANLRNYLGWLKKSPFDVLCVSAGGNDQLSARLSNVFRDWIEGNRPKVSGREAYQHLIDTNAFDELIARYTAMLETMKQVQAERPSFRVVAHTYVPLQRIGDPGKITPGNLGVAGFFMDHVGPWLWAPMQHVVTSKAEAKVFADALLFEGFRNRVLKPLVNSRAYGGFFSYADFSGVPETADPAFWYDEIHPTEEGFRVLAKAFNTQIRSVVPKAKQGAV